MPTWLDTALQVVKSQLPAFILGGLLGPLVLEALRRPWLALKFKADPEYISRTTERSGPTDPGVRACYVRVKAKDRTWRVAKNCRAYLVKIEKQDERGNFVPTGYVDPMQLIWSAKGSREKGLLPIDLQKYAPQFFDVISVRENQSSFRPEVEVWLFRDGSLLMEKGTFRFTVSVSGDNVKPATKRICLSWDGDIDKLKAWPD